MGMGSLEKLAGSTLVQQKQIIKKSVLWGNYCRLNSSAGLVTTPWWEIFQRQKTACYKILFG